MRGPLKRRRGSASPAAIRSSLSLKTGVASSLSSLPRISLSNLHQGSISDFFSPKPKLIETENQIKIDVYIKSNWGDEKMISLSEIDFLDVRGHPIEVIKITPQHLHDQSINLKEMSNHTIVKDSIENCWHHIWPYARRNLIFTFTLRSSIVPVSARIWNISSYPETQTKDIEIRLAGNVLYEGVIPQNYGSVVYLKNYMPLSLLTQEVSSTQYPYHKSDHLSITILQFVQDYNPHFSFSVEIYDQNNKTIRGEDIVEIKCENCLPIEAKERYIIKGESRRDIMGSTVNTSDPIKMARISENLPKIIIDFSVPICVAYVKIFGKAVVAPGVHRVKLETSFGQSIISTTDKDRIFLIDPASVVGYLKNNLLDA